MRKMKQWLLLMILFLVMLPSVKLSATELSRYWGEEQQIAGITQYIDSYGVTYAQVREEGITWLREMSGGMGTWYGIDNTSKVLPSGAMFYVKEVEDNSTEFFQIVNAVDSSYEDILYDDHVKYFQIGLKAADGTDISILDNSVTVYMQSDENWKEDFSAIFVNEGEDESVCISCEEVSTPMGNTKCATFEFYKNTDMVISDAYCASDTVHDYQFVWEPDYSSCKFVWVCEKNENHVQEMDCLVFTVVKRKPTCVKTGIRTYTASYAEYNDTVEVKIPKLPVPKKGKKIKHRDSNGYYKITKAGVTGGAVTFLEPMNKRKKSVSIPATIKVDGIIYKVTAITANAFKGNTKITSLKIGKNVKSIGKRAFYGCTKLKKIVIYSTKLKTSTVGTSAFKGAGSKYYGKVVVKIPSAKYKSYKKLLQKKGLSKEVKFKKF